MDYWQNMTYHISKVLVTQQIIDLPVVVICSGPNGAKSEECEGKSRKVPYCCGVTTPLHYLTKKVCTGHILKQTPLEKHKEIQLMKTTLV